MSGEKENKTHVLYPYPFSEEESWTYSSTEDLIKAAFLKRMPMSCREEDTPKWYTFLPGFYEYTDDDITFMTKGELLGRVALLDREVIEALKLVTKRPDEIFWFVYKGHGYLLEQCHIIPPDNL